MGRSCRFAPQLLASTGKELKTSAFNAADSAPVLGGLGTGEKTRGGAGRRGNPGQPPHHGTRRVGPAAASPRSAPPGPASPAPSGASGFLPSSMVAEGARPPSPAGPRAASRPAFRRPALPRRAPRAPLRLRPPARHRPGRCHGNVPPPGRACAMGRGGGGRAGLGNGASPGRGGAGNRDSAFLTKKSYILKPLFKAFGFHRPFSCPSPASARLAVHPRPRRALTGQSTSVWGEEKAPLGENRPTAIASRVWSGRGARRG